MGTHLFFEKPPPFYVFTSRFQREPNDIHRHSVITWHVNTPEDKVASQAEKLNSFYSGVQPDTDVNRIRAICLKVATTVCPMLVSQAMFTGHAAPSGQPE